MPHKPGDFSKPANDPGFYSVVIADIVVTEAARDYGQSDTECVENEAQINDRPGTWKNHPRDMKGRLDNRNLLLPIGYRKFLLLKERFPGDTSNLLTNYEPLFACKLARERWVQASYLKIFALGGFANGGKRCRLADSIRLECLNLGCGVSKSFVSPSRFRASSAWGLTSSAAFR